jgi:hypothetical protein
VIQAVATVPNKPIAARIAFSFVALVSAISSLVLSIT